MKENQLVIFIDKPVKEVFEYSLESNNVPKWITSIKQEIPEERPVKLGTKLRNIGINSENWNEYEVIEFKPVKTFTLKRLNGDYFVRYTCTEKNGGTEFEYYEWAEKEELDSLMEMSALELLKQLLEGGSKMENKICQSCGMPISSKEEWGTNQDGNWSEEYCKYCYENGEFKDKVSMEEYIEICSEYADQAGMTKAQMKEYCQKLFPTLKRWQCTCTEECASRL